jgi:Uma2 family endonuclease
MGTAAVTTRMSVEEYLSTPFRPDVDFVDGAIEERNLGEFDHARLQGILLRLLANREEEWDVYVLLEVRVQVSPTRFRVPDVCVIDAKLEVEQIIRRAPMVCLEVASPEDRLPRLLARAKDFHAMGVAQVWVFDPETRKVWISAGERVEEWTGGMLKAPGMRHLLT